MKGYGRGTEGAHRRYGSGTRFPAPFLYVNRDKNFLQFPFSCLHTPLRTVHAAISLSGCLYLRGMAFFGARRAENCLWPPLALRRRRAYAGHFLSRTAQSRRDGAFGRNGIRRRKDGQKKRRLRKAPARDIALSAVPCSASCESGWPWGVFACAALFLWTARHFFFACGDARKRENTYHCQCY